MSTFVVVGDLMTDVVARAMGPVAIGTDTPAWVEGYGGGAAANVAAWLGMQGADVAYVGRRGPDVLGRTREMELLGFGIDTHVAMDQSRPTGTCVVIVGENGERTMLPDPGASAALLPEDIPSEVFVPGGHLHLSGYPLFHDTGREGALTALRHAADHGCTVSVDVASVAFLERVGRDRFLSDVAGISLLLANADEAYFLAGEREPTAAAQALTKHTPQVVVKAGADGAVWCGTGDLPAHAPAPPVQLVDSTGAGDAFCAGLLPPWKDGASPAESLAAGCALAARAITQPGARPVD